MEILALDLEGMRLCIELLLNPLSQVLDDSVMVSLHPQFAEEVDNYNMGRLIVG